MQPHEQSSVAVLLTQFCRAARLRAWALEPDYLHCTLCCLYACNQGHMIRVPQFACFPICETE